MLKPFSQITSSAIDIVCHRGAHNIAPENTLPAVDAAFAAGFSYVEIDVFETADNQLVVIHDYQLERTTDGTGNVGETSLADLLKLDAGSWFDSFYQGIQLPLLVEVIALAKEYGGQLYIELKLADPLKVLRLVEEMDFLDHCFFWSFNKKYLRTIRGASSKARLMSRRQDYSTLDKSITDFDADVVEFHHSIASLQDIQDCRERGVRVMLAYSGDNQEDIKKLIQLSPDLMNVDSPFVLHKLLTDA
nr:glycerophosphodiester phosphodiesterase family protein [Sansalvadorimonas sp. 2012CJ34-2]